MPRTSDNGKLFAKAARWWAASHTVEWIDIKDSGFCDECLAKAMQVV